MQNGIFVPTYWANERMCNCLSKLQEYLRAPIKLNEGYTAFRCLLKRCFPPVCWGALMVKDMKKRLPPQCTLPLTRKNMSLLIKSACESIQYQSSYRRTIYLHAAVCTSSTTLSPLFSLDSPLSNRFTLHSVGYDAKHSRFQPPKFTACPVWIVRGKFSILATEHKPILTGDFIWSSKQSQQIWLSRDWWLILNNQKALSNLAGNKRNNGVSCLE